MIPADRRWGFLSRYELVWLLGPAAVLLGWDLRQSLVVESHSRLDL